jgi:hypothetical protein
VGRGSRAGRVVALAGALLVAGTTSGAEQKPVDPATGLVIDAGFEIVKAWCTPCHSATLVTRAGMTRAQWLELIRWMQETQGLWDLGTREDEILDYLSRNYAVPDRPARPGVIPLPP